MQNCLFSHGKAQMYGSIKWLKCILQLLCLAQHAWTPAVSILLELWDYIKRIVSLFITHTLTACDTIVFAIYN